MENGSVDSLGICKNGKCIFSLHTAHSSIVRPLSKRDGTERYPVVYYYQYIDRNKQCTIKERKFPLIREYFFFIYFEFCSSFVYPIKECMDEHIRCAVCDTFIFVFFTLFLYILFVFFLVRCKKNNAEN